MESALSAPAAERAEQGLLSKMLSKQNRIPRKDFKYLLEQKRYFNSPNFTLRFAKRENKSPQFSVSVSKKVSKKAVDRNRVRRRVYSVLRSVQAPEGMYFFIAKPSSINLKGEKLRMEIVKLISSLKS